jgi:hypothetical protein
MEETPETAPAANFFASAKVTISIYTHTPCEFRNFTSCVSMMKQEEPEDHSGSGSGISAEVSQLISATYIAVFLSSSVFVPV